MSDSIPSAPPALTPEVWRQRLAGLVVPEPEEDAIPEWRDVGASLVATCARFFNHDELDSKTMWTRIETAVSSAVAKAPNGEGDVLVSAALEHVKADAGFVAGDAHTRVLIRSINERSATWRAGLATYLRTALYTAMVFGRELHEERKQARADERERASAGGTA